MHAPRQNSTGYKKNIIGPATYLTAFIGTIITGIAA
jgi:hypothetical protein